MSSATSEPGLQAAVAHAAAPVVADATRVRSTPKACRPRTTRTPDIVTSSDRGTHFNVPTVLAFANRGQRYIKRAVAVSCTGEDRLGLKLTSPGSPAREVTH
jgi:hypothetical protein